MTPAARSLVGRRPWVGAAAAAGAGRKRGPHRGVSDVRSERRPAGDGSGGRDRLEGGGAEVVQDVEGAAGELAGDGQRRAGVAEPTRLEGEVVGVVGTARAARGQSGL